MDVDSERKWSSPISDRAKPNGSAPESQAQGHPPQTHLHANNSNLAHPSNQGSSSAPQQMSPPQKEQPLPAPSAPPPQKEPPSHPPPPPMSQRPVPPTPSGQSKSSPSPKPQRPPQSLGPPPTPTQQNNSSSNSAAAGQNNSPSSTGPPRKRVRRDEAPIWARKASRSSSSSPVIPAKRHPPNTSHQGPHIPPNFQLRPAPPPPPQNHPPPQQHHLQQSNAQPPPPPTSAPSGPIMLTGFGPWEPTIIGVETHDEMTRQIANFLYTNVVQQNDPSLSSGDGTILEIEAKVGYLIDKETQQRLRLPIRTETIYESSENHKIHFQSGVNKEFRLINTFLNEATANSKPQKDPKSRIGVQYEHTIEKDSFYELPPGEYELLPRLIRDKSNPRRTKVRVSTNKEGKVVKKIIKARISDLNIFSPTTEYDWRISVNVEMPWDGDHQGLRPQGAERVKDRMSYRHLVYQVDLTDVNTDNAKRTYELELEVDGAALRKQGQLVQLNKPNSYEQLVKGFVDNARVLLRKFVRTN
ncbi:CYTH-like domain-containing protein [Geopyxis carbonaria]|nr:CYTH-like domain-containing protein [Geopyxis carbonaria]